MLGNVRVKHCRWVSEALAGNRPLKPVIERLRGEASGLSMKAAEAQEIIAALEKWTARQVGEVRKLSREKPAQALLKAGGLLVRIHGLELEPRLRKLAARLKGLKGAFKLASILAEAGGPAPGSKEQALRLAEDLKDLIEEGPDKLVEREASAILGALD
jgi:hypothetical protein